MCVFLERDSEIFKASSIWLDGPISALNMFSHRAFSRLRSYKTKSAPVLSCLSRSIHNNKIYELLLTNTPLGDVVTVERHYSFQSLAIDLNAQSERVDEEVHLLVCGAIGYCIVFR